MHQIGVGALGPVFRTYEPERDRLVAVKAFRLDITPEQAQSLAAELSRAVEAGLFHPSIVEPIAAGVEGTAAYCAEEYVAAESLDVAMREYAPASVDTVLPIITQLAGAIDFARAAGIGHGALHPRDIFITPEEVRATGFGITEALERVGVRAPVRRPYSPPERIAGASWSTPADIFSLAAITYELLTGRRPAGLGPEIGPLTAGTPNGWMDGLHAVLARGMAEDPETRYQSALAFASALGAAARGEAEAGGASAAAAGSFAAAAYVGQDERAHDDREQDEGGAQDIYAGQDTYVERDTYAEQGTHERDEYAAQEPQAGQDPYTGQDTVEGQDAYEGHDTYTGHDIAAVPETRFEEHSPAEAPFYTAASAAGRDPDLGETYGGLSTEEDALLERDADDAHHRLSLDELNEEPVPRSPNLQFDEGDGDADSKAEAQADADEFILGVAAAASRAEPSPLDEFRAPAPISLRGSPDQPRLRDAGGTSVYSSASYSPGSRYHGLRDPEPEPTRGRGVWPIALLLILALLAGFGGGYALWGRSAPDRGVGGDGSPGAPEAASGAGAAPTPAAGAAPKVRNDAAASTAGTGSAAGAEAGAAGRGASSTAPPPATPSPAPAGAGGVPGRSDEGAVPPAAGAAVRAAAPAATGTLVIRSMPTRAGVSINGTWRGRTPLTVEGLPLGRQNVRVVQRGYAPLTQTVTLSAGKPDADLTLRLQPAKPSPARPPAEASPRPAQTFTGSIYVDSRPRGATVVIDGKPVGVTPLRVPEVRIGTHVVRLELREHRTWSSTARVTAGEEVRVTGSLEPIP